MKEFLKISNGESHDTDRRSQYGLELMSLNPYWFPHGS